jgi:hypothetical protein
MSEKKPIVLKFPQAQGNCPVCGKPSYSRAGTHPQCAIAQADALSRDERKKSLATAIKPKRKTWGRPGPKTQA